MIINNFIYYADDDQDDLDIFTEAIRDIDKGVVLTTFNQGSKIIDSLQECEKLPDVVCLDLNMPGMDGLSVLKNIRRDSRLSALPVIIVSTSGNRETINECEDNGATYYIPKPNDYDTLKAGLSHMLNTDWSKYDAKEFGFVFKNVAARKI